MASGVTEVGPTSMAFDDGGHKLVQTTGLLPAASVAAPRAHDEVCRAVDSREPSGHVHGRMAG